MYELYPNYSTCDDNFFFAQDERSRCDPPKLTEDEIEEIRNDWFEGMRRLRHHDHYTHNDQTDECHRSNIYHDTHPKLIQKDEDQVLFAHENEHENENENDLDDEVECECEE